MLCRPRRRRRPDAYHRVIKIRSAISRRSSADAPNPATEDRVMLIRNRKSRIYFLRRFFDYPITLSADTLRKLGATNGENRGQLHGERGQADQAGDHAGAVSDQPVRRRQLYLTFFKSYTEKVWGESCSKISAEWGAQRIKGLSIASGAAAYCEEDVPGEFGGIGQKKVETSLIEKFLYPKLGPGQLWDYVAEDVKQRGGEYSQGLVGQQDTVRWRPGDGR